MIHNSIQNQFMLADQLSVNQQVIAGCWLDAGWMLVLSFQQLLASQKSHRCFGLFHGEPWSLLQSSSEIRLGLASQGLRTRPDLAMSLHLSEWPE